LHHDSISPTRNAFGLAALLGTVLVLLFVLFVSPPPALAQDSTECISLPFAITSSCAAEQPSPLPATLPSDIAGLKTQAANAYDAVVRGAGSKAELARIEDQLYAVTSEPRRDSSARMASLLLSERYRPIRQVNWYYCGPASVSSMLWFLGARELPTTNADGNRPALTGRPETDQALLASVEWLGTENNEGTAWGGVVPGVLNEWRGTTWYVESATETIGGELTKDQAFRNIRYDLDRGYPVAANVLYDASTFYPAGFMEGISYEHWETIYGYFERDGTWFVRVGQVYGGESGYEALQAIPWDRYWTAIDARYGLVW